MRTHYEMLGVESTASPEEIKAAYRRLARTAHPDAGGNAGLFGVISDAYSVLSDPAQRQEYDLSLTRGTSPSPVRPASERSYAGPDDFDRRRSSSEYQYYRDMHAARSARKEAPPEPVVEHDWVDLPGRFRVGVGTVAWFYLCDLLRLLLSPLGLVSPPSWPNSYQGATVEILLYFLLGALFVVIFWAGSVDRRPVHRWEKVGVFLVSALLVIFGWEGVLLFLVALPIYARLTRRSS